MATMSGSFARIPEGNRSTERPELFADALVVSDPPRHARSFSLPMSIFGHGFAIALLALIPLLWPEIPPEHPDYIRALIYNPPPPPPPPLPKGSGLIEKMEPVKPVTPETRPEKPTLTVEVPQETPLKPEARERDTEQAGSITGSDFGLAEGMEEGQEGGVVGGVPGGVLGGVVGGTGDGPVLDWDQAPRLLKGAKPAYPQEAFVKKIEGMVELEILIDSTGRVVRARVVKSIPLLDAAAIHTVQQWIFAPAIKDGRPVATLAFAPVSFRIF